MIDDKIAEVMPHLSDKKAALARYISEHKYDAALLNAPMIARAAGVSEPTVTRLVYALGYANFSEFQLDLRRETQDRCPNNPFRQEQYGRKDMPVYKRVFELERNLMCETLNGIDADNFDACIDMLSQADRILLIGSPAHRYLAEYLENYLAIFHDNTVVIYDMGLPFFGHIGNATERTVAVFFSVPRYPSETEKMAKIAQDAGIKTIGITDSKFSPIIQYCTRSLIVPQRYLIFVDPNASVMALLHAILVAYYQKNEKDVKRRLEKYEKSVLSSDMFTFKDYSFATLL